ncbi:bifunctional Delta(1)-pyrroline-2-carboxylate/Delta(1)-piperideine-2-carboxylate reductase [Thiomonas sp. FB-Cd]|uniref:bifunctional Delta(1)-pyrroline-2-carboxylate/Delta(1)-piperideine-2- carboxylate reductase n=1 Tax=Thiomonas sp. FB-Cd TaxID=1158292 RepID=UPI0004DF1C35|nr:bifunctional Delta(1)-pyrroline-2-carboxylate/Delta(1)-piperideine-2-carboxylate reductase [Thiomonas sp. FB-Cd]
MNPDVDRSLAIFDAARTAQLLDFSGLMDAVEQAARELEAGTICSPPRLAVPLSDSGVMLSMPATARDIGVHKLSNVQPANARVALPVIQGIVTVCDAPTGRLLCVLDGPALTGRRTAAVSLVAIRRLLGHAPCEVLLYGTGAQARFHLQALSEVYPRARVWVCGRDPARTVAFCEAAHDLRADVSPCPACIPDGVDAVITLTTSEQPVYNEPARVGRVIVGVGAFRPEMAEIGAATLGGSEAFADDPAGALHEAGDFLRAAVDWSAVMSLGRMLDEPVRNDRPAVFKSVGTAAWDLAAARVALQSLRARP